MKNNITELWERIKRAAARVTRIARKLAPVLNCVCRTVHIVVLVSTLGTPHALDESPARPPAVRARLVAAHHLAAPSI